MVYLWIFKISNLRWESRKNVVKPALHGGWFLAPTTEQRVVYASYLHVWGKDRVQVPKILKERFKEFDVCWISPLIV